MAKKTPTLNALIRTLKIQEFAFELAEERLYLYKWLTDRKWTERKTKDLLIMIGGYTNAKDVTKEVTMVLVAGKVAEVHLDAYVQKIERIVRLQADIDRVTRKRSFPDWEWPD